VTRFLDANICIEFLRGRLPLALDALRNTSPQAVKIPAIVAAELFVGALKSSCAEANTRAIQLLLAPYDIVPFDRECVMEYARLRSRLEAAGERIGPHDQLIAATVLAHKGTLVTLNYKEFKRIAGLSLEVWSEVD
jgi:tRNA(fMet)-specific endonuclease VapC